MPRSRATQVGVLSLLPFPLHGVEVASRPLLKCLTRCASRSTVGLPHGGAASPPGLVSLSPSLPRGLDGGELLRMTPASSGEAVAPGPGTEPGALQGVSQ